MNTKAHLLRHLLPVSALLLGSPLMLPHLSAESVDGAVADAKSAATRAMLEDLDSQIEKLDTFEDNAPTPEEKAAAKARIKVLKQRRSELRKDYAQARYDALKADVKAEFDRLSSWTKKKFSTSPEAKLERKVDAAVDSATDAAQAAAAEAREAKARSKASANPAAAAASGDLDAYRANPSDENKADVKASMALLDSEIKRLEERVDQLPKSSERDATKARVKALKDRRGELASDFRKARFDALMADVKGEWNKLIH